MRCLPEYLWSKDLQHFARSPGTNEAELNQLRGRGEVPAVTLQPETRRGGSPL